MADWPFDQPPDCAVISIRRIAEGIEPILHVTHDEDDDGWQFLGRGDSEVEGGVVLVFREVLEIDPSILALADLPPGSHAWQRSVNDPWSRDPNPNQDDE